MNRWTTTGFPECECGRCSAECDDPMMGVCWVRGAVDRLAAYEDTGLTPAEIAMMREELERVTRELEGAKWINVTDKLPPSGEHVLLLCEVRPSIRQYICDGYYAARKSIPCNNCGDVDFEYDEDTDEYYLQEGYYEVIKNWEDYSSIAIDDFCIGWMPMPTIPGMSATTDHAHGAEGGGEG